LSSRSSEAGGRNDYWHGRPSLHDLRDGVQLLCPNRIFLLVCNFLLQVLLGLHKLIHIHPQ
jgi:hypothetical protein